MTTPSVVRLTLWGVRPRAVPLAVARMALDRLHLRRAPGLRFAKLLGTGDGRTFTMRDADPYHWGVLTVWDDQSTAQSFDSSTTSRRWDSLAHERLDVTMIPLSTRGRWSGHEPFLPAAGAAAPTSTTGQVASITRARLRPSRARQFWRAVPAVSDDLHAVPGMRLAVGIGEAPIGLQGTFTIWDDESALKEFAHRRGPHVEVMRASRREGWFAEELFARFTVDRVDGTFNGEYPGLPGVSSDVGQWRQPG